MMPYKRIRQAALLLFSGLLLLSGCGQSTAKTEEGMKLIEQLDYRTALELFEDAEKAGEDMRFVERGRGIAYMGLTDYESAKECFREALSLSDGFVQPMDYDINFYMAAACTKSGDYAEAEKVYDAILALKDRDVEALFLRGMVRLAQDHYEGAKKDFDDVVALEAGNYDRIIDIYEVMSHYGYEEEGKVYLNNVIDKESTNLSTFDKGRIYYYLGRYQDAALMFEQSKESGGVGSSLYLGRSYEALGEYSYALTVYSSYIEKDTSNAEIYNQLGICRMLKKDYQGALEAFQAGMKLEDSGMMQTLSFNEIMAYEYLGEFQKANVLLNSYLASYPDDDTALRERDFLSTR